MYISFETETFPHVSLLVLSHYTGLELTSEKFATAGHQWTVDEYPHSSPYIV